MLTSFIILLLAYQLLLCDAAGGKVFGITLYDASYLWSTSISNSDAHEHMQLLAALGGLVNRNTPQLFICATSADSTWLQMLQQPGHWLENATVTTETSIVNLVTKFGTFYNGAVLYDGAVPATSNVASSIAGIDGLLPLLSGGTLAAQLIDSGPMLPVVQSLVGRFSGSVTGSSKCDAYKWFVDNYMSSNATNVNPAIQGYLMDYWWALNSAPNVNRLNVAVLNADWVIANRGILWDLDVWPDTAPNDDPAASPGLDYEMLKSLLLQSYVLLDGQKMIHVAGFTPWAFKYITDEHDGVATEWQTAKLLSAYNAFVDADACCELNNFANAAFYQHYPLSNQLMQNPPPSKDDLIGKGYLDDSGAVIPKNYIRYVCVVTA